MLRAQLLLAKRVTVAAGRSSLHSSAVSRMAADADAAGAEKVVLTLSAPSEAFHKKKRFGLVTLPGVIGEYGVTAGHTPVISELKAGVVAIYENLGDSEPAEKWFISGGFAVTKENSETDVLATECFKLDQLDPERVRAGLSEYRAAMDSAAPESIERAKAQISFEVHEAMVSALGLTA